MSKIILENNTVIDTTNKTISQVVCESLKNEIQVDKIIFLLSTIDNKIKKATKI